MELLGGTACPLRCRCSLLWLCSLLAALAIARYDHCPRYVSKFRLHRTFEPSACIDPLGHLGVRFVLQTA